MGKYFDRGKYRDEDRVIGPALDALENACDVLYAVPDDDWVSFFTLDAHKAAAAAGDARSASLHLLRDAFNWMKFFWYSSAYKARQLAEGLMHSYNTDNYLAWMILGRSSLEYAALTHYFVKRAAQFRLGGPKFEMSQLQAFEDLMLKYVHGSRFDWTALMESDLEKLRSKYELGGTSKAVHVLDALRDLVHRDPRYADLMVAYDMLSDFAHPNMASHAAVVGMPEATTDMHRNHLAAHPDSLRGEFLMVVSLPWVSTGIGTTVELLLEQSPLLQTWLGYIDGETEVTIDFLR